MSCHQEKAALLHRILLAWAERPELRLGQLIYHAVTKADMYYIWDEELVARIECVGDEHRAS
jgi:hypothetical protein